MIKKPEQTGRIQIQTQAMQKELMESGDEQKRTLANNSKNKCIINYIRVVKNWAFTKRNSSHLQCFKAVFYDQSVASGNNNNGQLDW